MNKSVLVPFPPPKEKDWGDGGEEKKKKKTNRTMSIRNLDKRLFSQNLYSEFANTRNVGSKDKPFTF